MLVKMLETAANPARVLRAGKTYDLPEDEARLYLATQPPAATEDLTAQDRANFVQLSAMPDPEDKGPPQPAPKLQATNSTKAK